ncbi:MAG: TMEM175 family protein [Planctomycetales bacterium]
MTKNRLEAFSDGVLAIIITIMVLTLKVPEGTELADLKPLIPTLLAYVLSFVHVGIYWNNHHHLFQAVEQVTGPVLWANLHLLFWLSLIPVTTDWIGAGNFALWPVIVYGMVLFCSASAFVILTHKLMANHEPDSTLRRAIGDDFKGKISLAVYVAGILAAFIHPYLACVAYSAVAIIWLIPDRRIEEKIT